MHHLRLVQRLALLGRNYVEQQLTVVSHKNQSEDNCLNNQTLRKFIYGG